MIRFPEVSRAMLGGLVIMGACMFAPAVIAQSEGDPDVQIQSNSSSETDAMTKGEQRLADLLEGRIAGEPVRCIHTLRNQPMQMIDRTAYVYGRGETIYVQRTSHPESIDDTDALVSNRFSASDLCRQDLMTTIDPVTGIFTGAVFFEDFIPYTRIKAATSSEG